MGNSVNVEMSLLLLLVLVLPLSNRVCSEQSGLKENVKDDLEETMYKMDDIENKVEELERKLETKNVDVENLQKQLKEMEVQFESKVVEEVDSLKSAMTMQFADLQNQCKAEVKKEVDKVLPTAVEQGLRDLPFEMVCAYQHLWTASNSVIKYDRITAEFNNSDRPGGGDGRMNIETGVFTTVTSGYYIVTYGGRVAVHAGEYTDMWLYHNWAQMEESQFRSYQHLSGDNYIQDQGSRTVILHLLAGDTLFLRTTTNSWDIHDITLCLYMAPAPYGL